MVLPLQLVYDAGAIPSTERYIIFIVITRLTSKLVPPVAMLHSHSDKTTTVCNVG